MADSPIAQQAQTPKEIYGLFAGNVDQMAVSRFANAAAVASSNAVTHIHLVFQTMGGSIPDAVALYNLFRNLPIPLTIYNVGSVASAGVVAYLGAPSRATSTHATFMIHRTTAPSQFATSERLQAMAQSVVLDDDRIQKIFDEARLTFTKSQSATHKVADLWLSADEAMAAKLATETREFAPPKGTQLFSLGPI